MPEHRFGLVRRPVCALAHRPLAVLAKPAFAATNVKWHNNPVPGFQFAVFRPHLDDFTHEFMTENVSGVHFWNVAVIKMQIRSAYGGRRDLNNGIAWRFNTRIGNLLDADIALAVIHHRLHMPYLLGF